MHQFIINRTQLFHHLFFFGGLRCDKYSREETIVFLVFESEHTVMPRISSFRGNYSFLKVENVEIFVQFPHYGNFLLHEFKGDNYSREETLN